MRREASHAGRDGAVIDQTAAGRTLEFDVGVLSPFDSAAGSGVGSRSDNRAGFGHGGEPRPASR